MIFEQLLNPHNPLLWVLLIEIVGGTAAVLARPFSTYIKFVYPNAKFEAIGNPFLHEKNLGGLLQSKDLTAFVENINAYKDYVISGNTTKEIQHSFDTHFFAIVEMMRRDSTKKLDAFYNAYLQKYDIHLIKNELNNLLVPQKSSQDLQAKAMLQENKQLLRDLHSSDPDQKVSVLKAYGFSDEFLSVLQDKNVSKQLLDIQIDKFSIQRLDQSPVPYKCEAGKHHFIGIIRDMRNVKNLIRAKHLSYDNDTCKSLFIGEGREIADWKYDELAEAESVSHVISGLEATSYYEPLKNAIESYSKENSVQYLENALDSHLIRLVREVSQQFFVTIGPTIRFLVSKEFEVQNLKVVAKGVAERLSPDRIQRLLITEGVAS